MKNLLPNDFYEARNALGLSLAEVAKKSGINRNYLSNFEKKKYFLDDQAKAKLRDFYLHIDPSVFDKTEEDEESASLETEKSISNIDVEAPQKPVKPVKRDVVSLLAEMGYRLVDGRYVAPSEVEDDIIDEVRESMTNIDDAIENLISETLPTKDAGFFSDGLELDKGLAFSKSLEVVKLLALKQLQHDALQGTSAFNYPVQDDKSIVVKDSELESLTIGEFTSRLLHSDNDLLSEIA